MASIFCISTFRLQRRQLTLRRCWGISVNRSAAIEDSDGPTFQKGLPLCGRQVVVWSEGRCRRGLPALMLGMRQLAGRTVIPHLNITRTNVESVSGQKIGAVEGSQVSEPWWFIRL